jgi:ribosomal protein S18 acetylase RimI-like enzyme
MTHDIAEIVISGDPSRLDLDVIHGFLARSHWAAGIPRELVERAVRHSLCFGAYVGQAQIGFARVITDRATYAYVSDVFVLPTYRGRGIGTRLIAAIRAHPELEGLRRWQLVTRDAHRLYQRFGFAPVRHPERVMEILGHPYAAGAAPALSSAGGGR